MIKYGVWHDIMKVWCVGKYPYLCNEDKDSSTDFNTSDINFAFKYRESIANGFPEYSYEVREYK